MMKEYTVKQVIFALITGFGLSWLVYQSSVQPPYETQRQTEEVIINKANVLLIKSLNLPLGLEVIDPIKPDKDVGKTYISPNGREWQVSGYYRRNELDEWHPWLINLDENHKLIRLSVQDDIHLFSEEILENSLITIRSID